MSMNNQRVPDQYLAELVEIRKKISEGEATWSEAMDLRNKYGLPQVSSDTVRKGAFLFDEFNESGWINPPPKEGTIPNRETVSINKDGSRTSEKIVKLDNDELADEECLLLAHGYDPSRFSLVSARNTIWQQGDGEGGTRNLYSSRIVVQPNASGLDFDDIKKHFENFRSPEFEPGVAPYDDYLAENGKAVFFGHYDTHFGRYASEYETGAEYGMESARQSMKKTTYDLVKDIQNTGVAEIFYVVGQDFFNSSFTGSTTSQSHLQDNAATFNTIFKKGTEAIIECIDILAKVAPVKVIFCSGNHSRFEEFALAQLLEAYYKDSRIVSVDASPFPRKYVQYGVSCVGITHGSDEKERIYGLMQTEASQKWADTKCHVWLTGHIHHNTLAIKEQFGVSVFSLSALCNPDNWTVRNGYTGAMAGCVAFIFDKKNGLKGLQFYHV